MGALLATYSLSSGLLTWAAVLPQFSLHKQRSGRLLAAWCGAALLVFATYLVGFETPPGHLPWSACLTRPLEFPRYVATCLGLPLGAFDTVLAPFVGVATVIAFALAASSVVRRELRDFERLLGRCTLALFALLSAAATGVGRVGFGAAQALSSRYSTIAGLLLLAAVVVIALDWEQRARAGESVSRGSRSLVALLAALALAGHFATA